MSKIFANMFFFFADCNCQMFAILFLHHIFLSPFPKISQLITLIKLGIKEVRFVFVREARTEKPVFLFVCHLAFLCVLSSVFAKENK